MSQPDFAPKRRHPLAAPLTTIDRVLSGIDFVMMAIACALICAIMLLISADAASRYLFHAPISYTYDLVTIYMLPASLLFALSFTLRRGGHVNLDLVIHAMSDRLKGYVTGILLLIATPIVVLMAMGGAEKTWHSWNTAEVTIGVHAWPIWISEIIVPISMGMLALRMVHIGVANLFAALCGVTEMAVPISPPRDEPAEEAV